MDEEQGTGSSSNTLRNVLLGIAVVYVILSLFLIFQTRSRVADLEKAQLATTGDVKTLTHRLGSTENNLKASTDALGERLGISQQDMQKTLASRTAQLERQQHAAEQRLTEEQKQAVAQVSGEVAGVKTDLGSAKTDIASTKTDLEATKQKLEHAIGDLGVQSGLIARTRDDLDYLKHKGDRNYYEFTLQKGKAPTPVSTVSLQLKKTDQKKGRFTLNVLADDHTVEKKDRTVLEPLQFYTGRDRTLYEIVVMTVDKNKVTGYIATPKTIAAPAQ
jgi:hypothetical protein